MPQADLFLDAGATFSPCETYRYRLWRIWDETLPVVGWVMLNPSTADATANDPTVERCQRRAQQWDYGGIVVTNLFAFRATDPNVMLAAADPIGPDNDGHLCQVAQTCALVICAWGNHGRHRQRSAQVRKMLVGPLYHLGLSKTGEPKHPLYLGYNVRPIPWESQS